MSVLVRGLFGVGRFSGRGWSVGKVCSSHRGPHSTNLPVSADSPSSRANAFSLVRGTDEYLTPSTMSPRREFRTVAKRLESFFRPVNYTNVEGLILLGY